MDEPSIYDYIVSLFNSQKKIDLPREDSASINGVEKQIERIASSQTTWARGWKLTLGCMLAVTAQYFFEPHSKIILVGISLYITAFLLIWSNKHWDGIFGSEPNTSSVKIAVRMPFLVISIISQVIAFVLFKDRYFNAVNIAFWLAGIVFLVFALWSFDSPRKPEKKETGKLFSIAIGMTLVIILFFRFFQINAVPPEMYSDHAEKLLDVIDILAGKYPIFFERNTGREPLQFYVTALISNVLNTGISFLSLKTGTILFGVCTLPFIYMTAKELGNRWIGLAAVFFAGVAYWPNVISRVGLRYALYPLFTAPVIYFLLKGLKYHRVNYFILCGLFIGFGLHGYSSFRIVPVLVTVIMLGIAFPKKSTLKISDQGTLLMLMGFIALSVFLPLFRYWFDHPGAFSYRTMTRLTPVEKAYEAPVLVLLAKNTLLSLLMPFWNNGHIWVHSIPNRPALDFISGGFYFVGLIIFIKQILTKRNLHALALLLSIPILMLPSILSLAYPGENPSLNRSAGAYVPIFIITGYGFFILVQSTKQIFKNKLGNITAAVVTILTCGLVAFSNYNLVFKEYNDQFLRNSWNTSEMGGVIQEFLSDGNWQKEAYVIPYPHWVDTRLVGFNAGFPGKDFALWREDILLGEFGQSDKMFIYKPEDMETGAALSEIYPDGKSSVFYSKVSGKDFIIYTVLSEKK